MYQHAKTNYVGRDKSQNLRSALTEMGKLICALSYRIPVWLLVCIAEAVRFPELSEKFFEVGPQRLANIIAGYLEKSVKQGEIELTSSSEVAANIFITVKK